MTLHKVDKKNIDDRICQGDIFRNVPYIESYSEVNGEFELNIYEFPYVVVLTQDCDLEQNANERKSPIVESDESIRNDKFLFSIIVAPLYNAQHVFEGKHLSEIGVTSQVQNSKLKSPITNNQNPRYHYLEFDDDVQITNSIVDFKHYFSVSLNILEKNMRNRVGCIKPLYRELISQRYSNYLSRIGLPNPE